MSVVFFVFTILSLCPLVSLLFYVIRQGVQRFDLLAFTQLPPAPNAVGGGFANALGGTIVMVAIACSFSIPIGVFGAVYVVEFGERLSKLVILVANILYSVPSILIGVFVYSSIVLPTTFISHGRYSFSALAGGIALGIVMLPIVFRTTVESLKQIDAEIRWAGLAVGATASQVVLGVVLPGAGAPIVTGILLGIARIAGETAPLIFTALFNQYWARSLLDRTASLSVLIYEFSRSPFVNQQQLAWTTALVLCILLTIGTLLGRFLTRRKQF